jgi:hypothetical protein
MLYEKRRYVSYRDLFKKIGLGDWYIGDFFTKVGFGMIGGSAIGLYFNFQLGPILWIPFTVSFGIGSIIMIVGYGIRVRNEK